MRPLPEGIHSSLGGGKLTILCDLHCISYFYLYFLSLYLYLCISHLNPYLVSMNPELCSFILLLRKLEPDTDSVFIFIYCLHFPETVFRNTYISRHTQLSQAQSEFIFRIVSRACLDVSSVSSVSPHLGRQLHPEPIERLQVLALSSLRRVLKCLQPMCSFKASFDAFNPIFALLQESQTYIVVYISIAMCCFIL